MNMISMTQILMVVKPMISILKNLISAINGWKPSTRSPNKNTRALVARMISTNSQITTTIWKLEVRCLRTS